ncbi:MAG TPA: helix-turn-helix domain-containing protein, partial [Lacipirellulaceae bacterium]|nr:helix-turn-helix domain-containing protein [Lacipirellulaceae bacterium]
MFSNSLILVAGGEPTDRETILHALGDEFHVVASQSVDDALAHVSDSVGLVICDLESPLVHGMDLLRSWKSRRPQTPFLALTDGKDVGTAVEAMKSGASDCLVKPVDQDELRSIALSLIESPNAEGSSKRGDAGAQTTGKPHIDIPPDTSLEDLERAAVEQALIQHHGNRTHAAKMLGISVRTLQRKLKAWGMPTSSFHNSSSEHEHSNSFI